MACQEGRCVSAACPEAACPDGERCVQETCFPVACEAPCAAGEVCAGGRCVDESCALAPCAEGEQCISGTCYAQDCPGKPCSDDEVCKDGACVELECLSVSCPQDEKCRGGKCVLCAARETLCYGGVDEDCDSAIDCADSDCAGQTCGEGRHCEGGACVVIDLCHDGEPDGQETDEDCGGPECSPCGLGRACGIDNDCRSGACRVGRCVELNCSNQQRDGSETDVDCGGYCPGCALGQACHEHLDCASGLCVDQRCTAPASCRDVLALLPSAADGFYLVDPDGPGGLDPIQTFCLMSYDGGGWTLAQRTVWDPAETGQLRTTYAAFRGAPVGSPTAGHAFRLPGAWWPSLATNAQHLMVQRLRKVDGTSCEPLYFQATGSWLVPEAGGAQVAGLAQTVAIHNVLAGATTANFSTADNAVNPHCVDDEEQGLPWTYVPYANGCCETCPGFAGGRFSALRPMMQLTGPDLLQHDLQAVCGNAAVEQTAVGSTDTTPYYGVDSMEYYLR
jgi:hypothetical protein